MGVYIEGMYINHEAKSYEERDTLAVILAVATGENTNMYRIYMDDQYSEEDFGAYNPGDKITVRARPYVGKSGKLSWADGEIA